MKGLRFIGLALLASVLGATAATAQSWQPLTNQPTVTVGPMLQMRDGRLLVHEEQNGNPRDWYFLTPDSTGSYVNGTWTLTGLLPSNYSPFYFSSQVMVDGVHILVEGGEYNFGSGDETNIGALGTFVPFTGDVTWVNNAPPTGWGNIGDAQSVLLPNGQYLQGSCCRHNTAIYNGPNSWTISGSTQGNPNEAGWTLLNNGKVLMTDAFPACGSNKSSEIYDPSTGLWTCGPQVPTQLWGSGQELGATALMYNGKVLQIGGLPSLTAIYDPTGPSWSAGPNPPNGMDQPDGPNALEPNGKVLAMLSSGEFLPPCQFAEYDPVANTFTNTVNDGTQCPADPSFVGHLMILPTGQIMSTDLSANVQVYTPQPGVVSGVAPTIIPATNAYLGGSKNNTLYGIQLNGLSENNYYGDDYQAATNYPLIRFTNSGGKVWYGFTHDDSSHSIAKGIISFTKFDLNPAMPPGTYMMQVVTNGIGSNQVQVQIH